MAKPKFGLQEGGRKKREMKQNIGYPASNGRRGVKPPREHPDLRHGASSCVKPQHSKELGNKLAFIGQGGDKDFSVIFSV
jgi:hypothetical protein